MAILLAHRWSNGNVMVFDERGEQVPHLQGRYEDVRADVLNAADDDTLFYHSEWGGTEQRVSKKEW